jgi:hypothetical protein
MIDFIHIRGKLRNAYLQQRDDEEAIHSAMGDVRMLIEEVERLRAVNAEAEEAKRRQCEQVRANERAACIAWLQMLAEGSPASEDLRQAAEDFRIGRHRNNDE